MTRRSTAHATFTMERFYDASPARVFHALADPKAKRKWFVGPGALSRWEMEFRVGGRKLNAGGPKEGPLHVFHALYHDIVMILLAVAVPTFTMFRHLPPLGKESDEDATGQCDGKTLEAAAPS